jgi:hypothetical protein
MACICDLDLAGAAKEQHWKCLIANGVANKNQKDFVRLPDSPYPGRTAPNHHLSLELRSAGFQAQPKGILCAIPWVIFNYLRRSTNFK